MDNSKYRGLGPNQHSRNDHLRFQVLWFRVRTSLNQALAQALTNQRPQLRLFFVFCGWQVPTTTPWHNRE